VNSRKISVVVGNPKAGSRTLRVAVAVADALSGDDDEPESHLVVDLADFATEMFDVESSSVREHLQAVANSHLVIVASPTYKATFTGLLKAFLDRYPNDALAGTVCIPVMTGAAPFHALALDVHLRPLLVELGASVPSRGLYVTEPELDDLDQVIATWVVTARPPIERALSSPARSSDDS
jgi:FMN reductase